MTPAGGKPGDLLTVPDRAAWRAWLDANEEASDGVWLVLAKSGRSPASVLRDECALEPRAIAAVR
ncbi:hypothetical protein [Clavibacter michiganensis]|uniref:hypothetical protein n=1 Tax=Clavibacter michiganensis TaxID=28447 RepID=UPI003EB99337